MHMPESKDEVSEIFGVISADIAEFVSEIASPTSLASLQMLYIDKANMISHVLARCHGTGSRLLSSNIPKRTLSPMLFDAKPLR